MRLTEYTPLPWEAVPSSPGDGGSRPHDLVIVGNRHEADDDGEDGEDGEEVVTVVAHVRGNETSGAVTKADADLIVQAVNNHHHLVRAIKDAAEFIELNSRGRELVGLEAGLRDNVLRSVKWLEGSK